jgi:hypothetical protein
MLSYCETAGLTLEKVIDSNRMSQMNAFQSFGHPYISDNYIRNSRAERHGEITWWNRMTFKRMSQHDKILRSTYNNLTDYIWLVICTSHLYHGPIASCVSFNDASASSNWNQVWTQRPTKIGATHGLGSKPQILTAKLNNWGFHEILSCM